jgi:hypothetical protein
LFFSFPSIPDSSFIVRFIRSAKAFSYGSPFSVILSLILFLQVKKSYPLLQYCIPPVRMMYSWEMSVLSLFCCHFQCVNHDACFHCIIHSIAHNLSTVCIRNHIQITVALLCFYVNNIAYPNFVRILYYFFFNNIGPLS